MSPIVNIERNCLCVCVCMCVCLAAAVCDMPIVSVAMLESRSNYSATSRQAKQRGTYASV